MVGIRSNGCDNVFTNTFQNLATTKNEWIKFVTEFRSGLRVLQSIISGNFFQRIRFSRRSRLVGLDIVSLGKDTVYWDEITRLKMQDISDNNIVDIDQTGFATPNCLDIAVFFLHKLEKQL